MRRSLEEYQANVVRLKAERDLYEENMKKAFMRGVCALNMEAMSMFRYQDNGAGTFSNAPSNHGNVDNIPEENIQAHREEDEATTSVDSILNPPALSVNNQPTKTVHSCAPGSHVTWPPDHVTRAPGHVIRAPGHVTWSSGHVTWPSRVDPGMVVDGSGVAWVNPGLGYHLYISHRQLRITWTCLGVFGHGWNCQERKRQTQRYSAQTLIDCLPCHRMSEEIIIILK